MVQYYKNGGRNDEDEKKEGEEKEYPEFLLHANKIKSKDYCQVTSQVRGGTTTEGVSRDRHRTSRGHRRVPSQRVKSPVAQAKSRRQKG